MGWQSVSTYYARKPLRAEHPVGSGTIVEYKPGDVIPAGEWGPSSAWLVENGKAAEMFDSVWVDDDGEDFGPHPSTQVRKPNVIGATERAENPLYDETSPVEDLSYPVHEGAGWYQLSNGEKVRGKEDATAAEAALGDDDE
jgi:hypothetical protein